LKLSLQYCAAALLLLCSSLAQAPAPALAPRALLLLPFENRSAAPGITWIGESFPEVLGPALASPALFVVGRDERLYAFERVGIPADAQLSRATLYRISEQMDVDLIVLGHYEFDGRTFSASAQLLDARSLKLSSPARQAGPLVDLMAIQSALAWDLLQTLSPDGHVSRQQFLNTFPRVRLDALENYVRGLLATAGADRIRHLREAVRLSPAYSQARLQLGKAQFEARDYAGAAATLAQIPEDDALGRQAHFHLGLAAYYTGDFAIAARAFGLLAARLPINEAHNNLGVIAARRGDGSAAEHFRRALLGDPRDPDYRFNLAVALFRSGGLEEAAEHLNQTLALQPDDEEAAGFLAAITAAQEARDGNMAEAPVRVPLERIRRAYDEVSFRQLAMESHYEREHRLASMDAPRRSAFHSERGSDLLSRGFLADAERDFRESIVLNPSNASGHAGLAQVLEQRGDHDGARAEASAALLLRPSADAFLVLARLDLRENRDEAALQSVQRALALEPGHEAALALQEEIAARAAGGGQNNEP
jgi:tetratricopeptide (TPR) repeat protein